MEEQLVSFETAKLAREKGFIEHYDRRYDEKTQKIISWKDLKVQDFLDSDMSYAYHYQKYLRDGYYDIFENNDEGYYVSAPTQSLLQKWLREIHMVYVQPTVGFHGAGFRVGKIPIGFMFEGKEQIGSYYTLRGKFKTYEEALEAGLVYALNMIK